MFDSPDYPKPLEESLFESWLDRGRQSPIPYAYLLIIWDELDGVYIPVYTQSRSEMSQYPRYRRDPDHRGLVAAYDLYSETRIA